jgi:hypothetical protein
LSAHPSEITESLIVNDDLEPPTPASKSSTKMAEDLDAVLEEQAIAAVSGRN